MGARVVNRGAESAPALVARALGRQVGGKGNILVLNDEAHHAYRIRRLDNTAEVEDEEEDELAEADRREATVWIDGLDRIHRVRGINLCVDLSATPFYLNRSGNDPGRPFPWIVSDFGLIDAIESGIVKIPQIPVQDPTGADRPAYFHLWRWIIDKKLTAGEKGGRKGRPKPEAVLRWAQHPIAQLAGQWHETFLAWRQEAADGRRPPVPPVFIIVCRDTRLAKVVYEWITGESAGSPPPIDEFLNRDGKEYTVRIDSKVVEEIASGVVKTDESGRLRFVLDTIGKTQWPVGKPPDEYLELVEKMNRRAIEEGGRLTDPLVPPGHDVRCIVSVAMLTEGWDATTVTHIVGIRPFESQLLCEQVVGRGLRRSQYHDLTVEEVAKVYGVPFELIPLKASPNGPPPPPPPVHHVYSLSPERDHLEIMFPRVEGYTVRIRGRISVAWDRVRVLPVDPTNIPDWVTLKGLSSEMGEHSLLGPGKIDHASHQAWRRTKRLQELEFEMARALTRRYASTPACEVPAHALFPQMLQVVRKFANEKVDPMGEPERKKDAFLEPYFSWAVETLAEAVVPDKAESPEVPRYEAHRGPGSTREVDFWTSKPVRESTRSHLNWVVMDTQKWEQSTAFYLDTDEHVIAFVKNFNLGFTIPYTHSGEAKEYLPDFLVRLQKNGKEIGTLILETKGFDPLAGVKEGAARRWVDAVNADGSYGRWAYRLIKSPTDTPEALGQRPTSSCVLESDSCLSA